MKLSEQLLEKEGYFFAENERKSHSKTFTDHLVFCADCVSITTRCVYARDSFAIFYYNFTMLFIYCRLLDVEKEMEALPI